MKNARWLLLPCIALLLLLGAARLQASGVETTRMSAAHVYSVDDDLIVRRPTVSFLEAIAFILAAVGCFFGVAAFVEAKTAQRLIGEMKIRKIHDIES